MALTPLNPNKRPDRSRVLSGIEGVARVGGAQVQDELDYWDEISALGGFLQMEASEALRFNIVTSMRICRRFLRLPVATRIRDQDRVLPAVRGALTTLALSQLLRREYDGMVRTAWYEAAQDGHGIDLQIDETFARCVMHQPKDEATEVLGEGYRPQPGITWYENETLFVSVHDPAVPSGAFAAGYEGVSGGEPFDGAAHLMLQPRLKATYPWPPE